MDIERKKPRSNILPKEVPVPEILRRETEMRKAFHKVAEGILRDEHRFIKTEGNLKVGLEVEYSVVTDNSSQAPEAARDQIIAENKEFTDVELGAAQLELRTIPMVINHAGLGGLEEELQSKESRIQASARRSGLFLFKVGTNPFVDIKDIVRTNKPKYLLVPNYHNDNKRCGLNTLIGTVEQVDVRDAAVVALSNSVQCNLEASCFADAVDKTNRSFMIGPMALALGANARFLEQKDTGLADTRMLAWEISHDTRTAIETEEGLITRVGLPGLYYQDLRDYFQQITVYPFILHNPEAAFQIGIGLNWRDTRIKFIENSIVIEFRPVSTQFTTRENVAMMLFYLGRLQWSCLHKEHLMNLKAVSQNREQAMRYGINSMFWTRKDRKLVLSPASAAIRLELERAVEGLKVSGFAKREIDNYFDLLRERIDRKQTPSDKLTERVHYYDSLKFNREYALFLAINDLKGVSVI